MWRSPDGSALSWTQVISNGFGIGTDNGWVDSLTAFGSRLYAVVRNYNSGVKVYSTSNGLDWTLIVPDGWGDPANQHTSDGNNAVAVLNGTLTIGTYNALVGGQVLQLEPIAVSGLVANNDSPTSLGTATNFTATIAAGNGESYAWSFGDGGFGAGSIVSYTYPSIGVFTATVTATNVLSEISAHTTVTVAQQISELVATNDSPTRLDQVTNFTATITAGSGESYAWPLRRRRIRRRQHRELYLPQCWSLHGHGDRHQPPG